MAVSDAFDLIKVFTKRNADGKNNSRKVNLSDENSAFGRNLYLYESQMKVIEISIPQYQQIVY